MKRKKSSKADLENKKPIFFLFGLVISLGFTLMAFNWQTVPEAVKTGGVKHNFVPEDDIIQPIRQKKEELQPKIIQPQIINIVENDIQTDGDLGIFDFGIDDNDPIYDIPSILTKPSTEEPVSDEPLLVAEFMPEFPGGQASLIRFLSENVKYPAIAQENGVEGKVYISFIINENGEISNAAILRGVDPLLDAEALRVINTMPNWKPGRQGAKAVKVRYSVPIFFELR